MQTIIGIGNEYLGDDGVGIYIIDRLSRSLQKDDVRLVRLALGGIELIEQLRNTDQAWIIDASAFGIPAGTIRHCVPPALPSGYKSRISSHFIGCDEAIQLGYTLYPQEMPRQIELILIEGERFSRFHKGLSPPTASAAQQVIAQLCQLLH